MTAAKKAAPKKEKPLPEVTREETIVRLVKVTVAKTEQDPQRVMFFTTHDSPVTVDGHQYIPISIFDQAKWLPEVQSAA